jgi:hypothetical protein
MVWAFTVSRKYMTDANQIRENVLPRWAPRISQELIHKLYHSVGRGFMDEELINDLGYAMLARCESIIAATDASGGSAACPLCKNVVRHGCKDDEKLVCSQCGWSCGWREYKKTYQGKQLHGGGIEEYVREYIQKFPAAIAPGERLVLIDTLIHRYHWENSDRPSRPGATNLIQGKCAEIIAFLDQLSYGEHIPPDIQARRSEWYEKKRRSDAFWNNRA